MEISNEAVTPVISGHSDQLSSVGGILRENRERVGMTVAEVSKRIKFAARQIEALEADDFKSLPEAAFIRGFVRSYARLLKLDAAPLLANLPVKVEFQSNNQVRATAVQEKNLPTLEAERKKSVLWIVLAGLLALVLLLLAFINRSESPKPENVSGSVEQAIELAVPSNVDSQPANAPEVNPASAVADLPTAVATSTEAVAEKSPAPVAKTSVVSVPEVGKGTSSTMSPIHLVFVDDAWVEIKDQSGKTLLSQNSLRGSQLWLNGQAPFKVSIKRSKGVRLYYRDKEIDLAAYANAETAHLTLE